jgi:hypothetical protein
LWGLHYQRRRIHCFHDRLCKSTRLPLSSRECASSLGLLAFSSCCSHQEPGLKCCGARQQGWAGCTIIVNSRLVLVVLLKSRPVIFWQLECFPQAFSPFLVYIAFICSTPLCVILQRHHPPLLAASMRTPNGGLRTVWWNWRRLRPCHLRVAELCCASGSNQMQASTVLSCSLPSDYQLERRYGKRSIIWGQAEISATEPRLSRFVCEGCG